MALMRAVPPVGDPLHDQLRRELTIGDAVALLEAITELSRAHTVDDVMKVHRTRARALIGADGVTFVLRDGDLCYYADEDAIAPLWKGRRFPARSCISGWCMEHAEVVAIPDVAVDPRIPQDAYAPTFVRSLAMVPVRREAPIAAIGAYWARLHRATPRELALLQALADGSAIALANVELLLEQENAIRAREEFVGIAAHELRTPLTALILALQGTSRRLEEGEPKQRIDRAAEIGRKLARLVERLLDLGSFMSGTVELRPERTDVGELVAGAVERFRETALGAGCELRAEIEPEVRAEVDRTRLDEVLDNLLGNACKYAAGRPIEVALHRSGHTAVIRVADHGIGVPREQRSRIFQRFVRAVPSRNFGGLGLGLYVANEIVRAHGGSIAVRDTPGGGATFTVELPIRRG